MGQMRLSLRKTMAIKIYGESNDTIIVSGDIEARIINANMDKDHPGVIIFNDGNIIKIWYDVEGTWRISFENKIHDCASYHIICNNTNDDEYSDILTISGQFHTCYFIDKWLEFKSLDKKD